MRQDGLFQEVRSHLFPSELLTLLQNERKHGRKDYSIQQLWDSVLSISFFQLPTISSLFRVMGEEAPSVFSISRFIAALAQKTEQLDRLLFKLVDVGPIIFLGMVPMGQKNLIFLVDMKSQIPFAWEIEQPQEHPTHTLERLFSRLSLPHVQFFIADSQYEPLCQTIWKKWNIKPIIPLPDEKEEKAEYKTVQYNSLGEVFCPKSSMAFGGFEERRDTLKYLCAAKHYGYRCQEYDHCPLKKNLRIPLKHDPRIFTPLPRFSARWQRLWSHYLLQRGKMQSLLLSKIPNRGNRAVFLRIASLLLAAAYRSKKLSKRSFN